MTDKLRPRVHYRELTLAQAEQVAREYPQNTDPHDYDYEVNPHTGRVTDRFKLNAPLCESWRMN